MNIETQEQYDELSQLTMSQVGLRKDMDKLQKSLLDYRRKNKIYEAGDSVVFQHGVESILDTNVVYKLASVTGDVVVIRGYIQGSHRIQHATDDEIELGRRTKLGECI